MSRLSNVSVGDQLLPPTTNKNDTLLAARALTKTKTSEEHKLKFNWKSIFKADKDGKFDLDAAANFKKMVNKKIALKVQKIINFEKKDGLQEFLD